MKNVLLPSMVINFLAHEDAIFNELKVEHVSHWWTVDFWHVNESGQALVYAKCVMPISNCEVLSVGY